MAELIDVLDSKSRAQERTNFQKTLIFQSQSEILRLVGSLNYRWKSSLTGVATPARNASIEHYAKPHFLSPRHECFSEFPQESAHIPFFHQMPICCGHSDVLCLHVLALAVNTGNVVCHLFFNNPDEFETVNLDEVEVKSFEWKAA